MALPVLKDTVFNVETRKEAIEVLAQGANIALHEHEANPLIYHAANELIIRDDRGQKTDIRALGLPHQVLAEVAQELHEVGVSAFTSSQIIEALEGYAIGLGADFAREAQAKPLYARIVVTDRQPDDIPDCALVQATLIDGQRRVGEAVSQRVMQHTIYGTRTSMTKEMNLDEMFASSKKKWLLIYYGSPSQESYKGLDDVDVSLINLIQGLGGKIPDNIFDEIQEKLKDGTLTDNHIDIIEQFSDIEKLLEAYSNGNDIPPQVKSELLILISSLSEKISVIQNYVSPLNDALSFVAEQNGINLVLPVASNDEYFIPSEMSEVIIMLDNIVSDENLPLELQKELSELLDVIKIEANEANDNLGNSLEEVISLLVKVSAVEGTPLTLFQSISSVLPKIVQMKIETMNAPAIPDSDIQSLVELVQEVSQSIKMEQAAGHTLPSQLIESIALIDKLIEGKTAEQTVKLFSHAIKNSKADPFAIEVQNIILSLAQPEIQAALQNLKSHPVKSDISNFAFQNAEIVQMAATSILIRDVEARLNGREATSPVNHLVVLPPMETAELKQFLKILKEKGVEALVKGPSSNQATAMNSAVIESILQKNPFIAEVGLTTVMTRELQSKLDGRDSHHSAPVLNLSLEPTEIKALLQILKSEGAAGLMNKDTNTSLPVSVQDRLQEIAKSNPSMVEAVLTGAVIRDIERKISGVSSKNISSAVPNAEPRELRELLDVIKSDGVMSLLKPQNQSQMTAPLKQVVEQFIQKNNDVIEAVAAIKIIKDIENNQTYADSNISPAEKNLIVKAIQNGGLSALRNQGFSENLSPNARQYVAALVVDNMGQPDRRMEPKIVSDIRKIYIPDSPVSMPSEAPQSPVQKNLSQSFNAEKFRQNDDLVSTLTRVLSQPSQGISAKDYAHHLEILDVVTKHVSANPQEGLKQNIATLMKSANGVAAVNTMLNVLNKQPTEHLSVQEQKSVMDVKKAILQAKIESHVTESNRFSDEVKMQVTSALQAAMGIENVGKAHQSLDKVREVLQKAGAVPSADFKELQSVVEQQLPLEQKLYKPTPQSTPHSFTGQENTIRQESAVPKTEARSFKANQAHNDAVQTASVVKESPKAEDTKPDLEISCPMGKNVCCCGDAFKAAAETQSLFQRLRSAVSGAFKEKETVQQTLSDRSAMDAAFDDALSPK